MPDVSSYQQQQNPSKITVWFSVYSPMVKDSQHKMKTAVLTCTEGIYVRILNIYHEKQLSLCALKESKYLYILYIIYTGIYCIIMMNNLSTFFRLHQQQ
jgi:hypothetical protein